MVICINSRKERDGGRNGAMRASEIVSEKGGKIEIGEHCSS